MLTRPLEELTLEFNPGDRISGRYVIEQSVGEGGMGVVYRAQDSLVNETVALKFMKPQLLRSQKGQMQFIKEAQIARRLRHENIVAVHDVSWTTEGILYLSMEFVNGRSLRAILRQHRKERQFIDVRLAVRLTSQVLHALEYAHRTVVHRDLKPENIMVLPGEHAKVLDFGLAMAADDETQGRPVRGKGLHLFAGTIAYSAPEQKLRRAVDFRADIYAVGLLLYELLTLRTPVDEQLPIPKARHDAAPSLAAVVERALAEEKEDRWPSAREFRERLEAAYEQSYRSAAPAPPAASNGDAASTEGMVYLEGGSFLMGNDGVSEEAPQSEAIVKPFYIDKYPVTNEKYGIFLKSTGHSEPKFWGDAQFGGPMQPVVGVSWSDACAYAAWAGKQLPSEEQWEFTARGKDDRLHPWGNLDPDTNHCNYDDYLSMTSNVNMHEDGQTPEGVCDLAGNVYEWTRDPFVPYDERKVAENGEPNSLLKAVRGGCWESKADEMRCSFRKGLFPETRLTTVGFRCVVPCEGRAPR